MLVKNEVSGVRRQDELMKSSIEARGHVFKTVGDAFCAAFPTVPDDISAARGLIPELWSTRARTT
ncbi:MAG: hypothetical protein M3Z14_01430 [Candidatus Eremiobacteraeota bacterium]|nr:hypothetical protein [Candidatus Eremiobacteraeota bacterium]